MSSINRISAPCLGDVLQNEYGTQVGYARVKAVANDASGVVYNIGAVMGVNGTKVRLFQTGDDFAGIFIGTADDKDFLAANGTDKAVVLLEKGPAAVGDGYLYIAGNAVAPAAVKALIAAAGIKIVKQTPARTASTITPVIPV